MDFWMKMPDVATNDSPIRIVRWLAQPGQRVGQGQPLVEVETDKATMEVESPLAGILKELRYSANDEVAAQQVIALLDVESAEAPLPAETEPAPGMVRIPFPAPSSVRPPAPVSAGLNSGRLFARNRARLGGQRIAERIALTPAQLTAGKRLLTSKQTVPHFYVQSSANVTLIAEQTKASAGQLLWDAFFVLAVARALRCFDRFRCRLDGNQLVLADTDAVGSAVDHEGELYVIPISAPLDKTVREISDEIRRVADGVRRGDPEARRLRPAQITVSNLGVCNVESFLPIINPPEVAILGVGRAKPTLVAQEGDRLGIEHRCTLTLSVDHRVISGKYAGDFLTELIKNVESTC